MNTIDTSDTLHHSKKGAYIYVCVCVRVCVNCRQYVKNLEPSLQILKNVLTTIASIKHKLTKLSFNLVFYFKLLHSYACLVKPEAYACHSKP